MKAIGVDLGGTKLRAGLVDPGHGIVGEARLELGDRSPEAVAHVLALAVEQITDQMDAGAVPIGIGIAAMLRGDTGVVDNAPNFGWRGVDFRGLLAERLPGHKLHLVNDVGAIAYGEYMFGSGAGAKNLLCIYAGTGIGGGIIADGRPIKGTTGIAGEIGHTKVVFGKDARLCGCGLHGCIEAYAGGRNLANRARAELRLGQPSLAVTLAGGDPEVVHAGHLDEAARQGDPYALRLWDEIGPLFGMVVANAVTLLNPRRVIMGGGLIWGATLLRTRVMQAYEAMVNPVSGAACQIVEAALGESAGILGAAALAVEA